MSLKDALKGKIIESGKTKNEELPEIVNFFNETFTELEKQNLGFCSMAVSSDGNHERILFVVDKNNGKRISITLESETIFDKNISHPLSPVIFNVLTPNKISRLHALIHKNEEDFDYNIY